MKCLEKCKENNISCKNSECRYFINYNEDLNCSLFSVEKNGKMTLQEIGERMNNITPQAISCIEKKALEKIKKRKYLNILLEQ